ncbi:MAG: hypothetical protein EOO40_07565, partial [Deltaproteobacteria bacterium]
MVLLLSTLSLFLVPPWADKSQVLQGLDLLLALSAVTATWRILTWRARRTVTEQVVWRMFATGCFLYGFGTLVTAAFAVVPFAASLVDVPAAVCAVAIFPLAYRALVRWSRHGVGPDPDDLLNGISSMLVMTA